MAKTKDQPKTEKESKTKCPVTKAEFLAGAKSIDVVINGQPYAAVVKEFSSGSFGFYLGDKVKVKIGDTLVPFQVGLNIIAIKSAEADAE